MYYHCVLDRWCRKSRSRQPWDLEAEQLTLRELRWWCHEGARDDLTDAAGHRGIVPPWPEADALPTMAHMDLLDLS